MDNVCVQIIDISEGVRVQVSRKANIYCPISILVWSIIRDEYIHVVTISVETSVLSTMSISTLQLHEGRLP